MGPSYPERDFRSPIFASVNHRLLRGEGDRARRVGSNDGPEREAGRVRVGRKLYAPGSDRVVPVRLFFGGQETVEPRHPVPVVVVGFVVGETRIFVRTTVFQEAVEPGSHRNFSQ